MLLRAMNRNKGFWIMDEPISSLDIESEYEIIERLLMKNGNSTGVYISHRLGMIKKCDKILVVNHGRIEEQGNHEVLMKANGLYCQMFNSQIDG